MTGIDGSVLTSLSAGLLFQTDRFFAHVPGQRDGRLRREAVTLGGPANVS